MVMKVLCMCCLCVCVCDWCASSVFVSNSNQSEMNVYRLIKSMCANLASLLYYGFDISNPSTFYLVWFVCNFHRVKFSWNSISILPYTHYRRPKMPRWAYQICWTNIMLMTSSWNGQICRWRIFLLQRESKIIYLNEANPYKEHRNSIVCLFWQAFFCCIDALVASCAQIFCCVFHMSNKWNDSLTHIDVCVCFFSLLYFACKWKCFLFGWTCFVRHCSSSRSLIYFRFHKLPLFSIWIGRVRERVCIRDHLITFAQLCTLCANFFSMPLWQWKKWKTEWKERERERE